MLGGSVLVKIRAVFFVIIFLFLGCLLFAYLWLDQSITLSYVSQSVASAEASKKRLEGLLETDWKGLPEDLVFEKLQAEAARHPADNIVVKKEGDIIFFDWIQFEFENGRLVSVGDG